MNRTIDRKKVYWMLKTGWHPERIADRLGASRRQIDRITRANGWTGTHRLTSFDEEDDLRLFYRDAWGESYGKIALRFGVSRQAIHQFFNQQPIRRAS